MPIDSITTDYTGRTIDIHIFQGVNPKGEATVNPSFGKISNYCTGIQKLIQRYTISLLSTIGSQVNFPNFGTNLLNTLNNGNYQLNIADLGHIFNFASAKVINELKQYQRTNTVPDDEALDTAILNSVSYSNNTVYFTVQIYPVQQPSVNFILPLPLT